MIEIPQIIIVSMTDSSQVLFLNGKAIHSLEFNEEGLSINDLAKDLAESLRSPLYTIENFVVPDLTDWNWKDVYERINIKSLINHSLPTPSPKKEVFHLSNLKHQLPDLQVYVLDVSGKLQADSLVEVEFGPEDGAIDDYLHLKLKIGKPPGADYLTQVIEIGHDADQILATIYKQGDKFLIYDKSPTPSNPILIID